MGEAERANLDEAVADVRRDVDATLGQGAVVIEIPWGSEPADAWIHVAGVTPTATGVVTHPGESLDPVTYALVDPDESVRARAQELLEQRLNRP